MNAVVIINPMAAGGGLAKRWPAIERTLDSEGFAGQPVFTEGRGHATDLALQAIREGHTLIVAAGGDGTINEVVNGMVADGKAINPEAQLGILPCGTGADFARCLGLPREILAAARHLAKAQNRRAIDLGEVVLRNGEREIKRYFINVASTGFSAEVTRRSQQGKRRGRGTWPYVAALAATMVKYRNRPLTARIDDELWQGRANSVIIGNGQFFGGGMRVAPQAHLADGYLDVVVVGDLPPLAFLWHFPKLYRGTHLALKQVTSYRARRIQLNTDQPSPVQVDGDYLGTAQFRVWPAAITLRG